MTLHRDPATSWLNRFAGDTSVAVHVMQGSTTTSAFEATSATARLVPGSTTTYSADIVHAVQSWVRGPNYGLVLRIAGAREFQSLDLVTFSNYLADPPRVPRLKIIYSVPKN